MAAEGYRVAVVHVYILVQTLRDTVATETAREHFCPRVVLASLLRPHGLTVAPIAGACAATACNTMVVLHGSITGTILFKLIFFSILMSVVPSGTFFASLRYLWDGKCISRSRGPKIDRDHTPRVVSYRQPCRQSWRPPSSLLDTFAWPSGTTQSRRDWRQQWCICLSSAKRSTRSSSEQPDERRMAGWNEKSLDSGNLYKS